MTFIRTSMTGKEMYEGYKANIPSEIMEKMGSGIVLTDKEKEIVRQHGKVYVLGYIKRKEGTLIKPQLRNLSTKRKSIDKFYGKFLLVNLDTNESLGQRSVFVEEVTKGDYEGGARYYISKGKKVYLYPLSSIVTR